MYANATAQSIISHTYIQSNTNVCVLAISGYNLMDCNNNETIFYFLRLSNLLNSEFLKVNKIEIKSYESILYNIIRKYFDLFMKINRTVLCVIYLGTLPKKRSNAYTAVDNEHIF